MRVLDLDLDFFVSPIAHWRDLSDLTRLEASEFSIWNTDAALAFLREACGLNKPLPGWAIERHGEAYTLWASAIEEGRLEAPFEVVHVDAHADLGLGESTWTKLMGEVMYRPPLERAEAGREYASDGSYLAFACAAGWIDRVTYVHPDGEGKDVFPYHMHNWDIDANALQMKAMNPDHAGSAFRAQDNSAVDHFGPPISFKRIAASHFVATEPFDAVVLCRSPNFTPPTADPLFNAILQTFVRPWSAD